MRTGTILLSLCVVRMSAKHIRLLAVFAQGNAFLLLRVLLRLLQSLVVLLEEKEDDDRTCNQEMTTMEKMQTLGIAILCSSFSYCATN